MTEQDNRAFQVVRKLFKNDYGEPFEMTPGQIGLFRAIYERSDPRVQFDCYTQYGKSDVVSMATLLRASTFPEKWIILGATKDKAAIIMGKLIKHIFENDYTLGKFEIDKDESFESIRRTQAKDDITFKVDEKNIGRVITLSADARRKSADAGDILIGHGGQNLIEDDAALIPDPIHGKALRMLGGHPDNFLLKITNSFGRNHAYRSRVDPKYTKYIIDYLQGMAEGRITPEFIEEMRQALDPVMFGILYECVYPPSDLVDDQGYMPILTEEEVDEAQRRAAGVQPTGKKRLGVDVAEGTNYNAFVERTDNMAWVKEKTIEKNLMETAKKAGTIAREDLILSENIFVDATGIGSGVFSRLHEAKILANGIKTGEKAPLKTPLEAVQDPLTYYNLRAFVTWKAREWVRNGGALAPHKDWMQLTKLRYKNDAEKQIKIMPKEEMRAVGLLQASESPDVADAFCLTFAPTTNKTYGTASGVASPFYPEIGL